MGGYACKAQALGHGDRWCLKWESLSLDAAGLWSITSGRDIKELHADLLIHMRTRPGARMLSSARRQSYPLVLHLQLRLRDWITSKSALYCAKASFSSGWPGVCPLFSATLTALHTKSVYNLSSHFKMFKGADHPTNKHKQQTGLDEEIMKKEWGIVISGWSVKLKSEVWSQSLGHMRVFVTRQINSQIPRVLFLFETPAFIWRNSRLPPSKPDSLSRTNAFLPTFRRTSFPRFYQLVKSNTQTQSFKLITTQCIQEFFFLLYLTTWCKTSLFLCKHPFTPWMITVFISSS